MRHLLLAATALLLLAGAGAANSNGDASSKAQRGLRAASRLVQIFNASILVVENVDKVSELLSDTVSFAAAFGDFFDGADETEESRRLLGEFATQSRRLLAAALRADDVKRRLGWTGVRRRFADLESRILSSGRGFDEFVASGDPASRSRFVREFADSQQAAFSLFLAIVDGESAGRNIAAAAVSVAGNYQTKVTEFLLLLVRLIVRGAQMQVAYERIIDSAAAADNMEAVWRLRMQRLVARLQAVDSEMRAAWQGQVRQDIPRLIEEHRRLENRDFVRLLYRFLADKYHWRYWFVVAYRDVGGWDNHAIWHCGGGVYFRVAGGRNVVVASADPATSRFWRPTAESLLRFVDGSVQRQYARDFLWAINDKLDDECSDAALRAAICWGCNVWYAGRPDRLVYRKANPLKGGHMNTFIFG